MHTYSLKDIIRSFDQKKLWEKQFPINYYIVRPLSFIVTWLIMKLTHSPGKVAWAGLIIGILSFFAFTGLSLFSLWPGLILMSVFSLLDAVDGNIARTTDNVTLFGKYLDGLFGDIIDGNYFFFLGLGLYFSDNFDGNFIQLFGKHSSIVPFFSGAAIVICRLFGKIFESRYEVYISRNKGFVSSGKNNVKNIIEKSTLSNRWYYILYINLDSLNNQLLLLIIFTAVNHIELFLLLFACFYILKAFYSFFFYFHKTKKVLSINE